MNFVLPEGVLDKIFVDEAVVEVHTIQDVLRWIISRLMMQQNLLRSWTNNYWNEALQFVLPSLLSLRYPINNYYFLV